MSYVGIYNIHIIQVACLVDTRICFYSYETFHDLIPLTAAAFAGPAAAATEIGGLAGQDITPFRKAQFNLKISKLGKYSNDNSFL